MSERSYCTLPKLRPEDETMLTDYIRIESLRCKHWHALKTVSLFLFGYTTPNQLSSLYWGQIRYTERNITILFSEFN